MQQANVLVFSVAMNGYQWLYRPLFNSHREYAKRFGYQYQLVQSPGLSPLGIEVAWLKLYLIRSALAAGYEWIVFLDADTEVSSNTPCVESLYCPKKSVYVATGYSGEINSGVLIVKNHFSATAFINRVLDKMGTEIPESAVVDWGENGHVIHVSKTSKCVHVIDRRWNNNSNKDLNDFIRHYSAGPLRRLFKPNMRDMFLYKVCHYWVAVVKRLGSNQEKLEGASLASAIEGLHTSVLKRYSAFMVAA